MRQLSVGTIPMALHTGQSAPSSPALAAARAPNLNIAYKQPYRPKGKKNRTTLVGRPSVARLYPPNEEDNLLKGSATKSQRGPRYPSGCSACLVGGCCIFLVIFTIGGCWYIFETTHEGKQILEKARKIVRMAKWPLEAVTNRGALRVGVEFLTHATDGALPHHHAASIIQSSTRRSISSCKRVLCEYQSSRWSVNTAVHPCDDFYSYVCSNWSKLKSSESAAFETDQTKEVEITLQTLLRNGTRSGARNSIVHSLYDSCLEKVSFADSKLFVGSLHQRVKLWRWPYKEKVLSESQMWEIHARIFRMLGVSSLVSVSVERDPMNSSRSIISLGPPPLFIRSTNDTGLPTWFLPSVYRATSIFDPDFYEDVSQRVLQFIVKLQGLYEHHKERPRVTTLNGHTFYTTLLRYSFDGIVQVHPDLPILVKNQFYLKALKSLISSTKSSSIYNYLGFRVLAHMSPLLSDEFSTMGRARMAWLTGRWQLLWPLWQRCLWFIDDMNPELLQSVYSDYAWHHLSPINAASLVQKLKHLFEKNFHRLEWCEGSGRARCVDFMNRIAIDVTNYTAMRPKLLLANITSGYFLEEYIVFKRQNVEYYLNYSEHSTRSVLSVFSRSPSFGEESNTLHLPLASFFEVFHNVDYDLLLRGAHLIHQVYSMLLEKLRLFLFPPAQKGFGLRPKCKAYRPTGRKTEHTLQQLLQDVTAWELTTAYFTESNWNKYIQVDHVSRDMNIFVLAAMGKCTNSVSESLSTYISLSSAPSSVAINELLSNSKTFSDVWACSKGAIMNPLGKCTLWKY